MMAVNPITTIAGSNNYSSKYYLSNGKRPLRRAAVFTTTVDGIVSGSETGMSAPICQHGDKGLVPRGEPPISTLRVQYAQPEMSSPAPLRSLM